MKDFEAGDRYCVQCGVSISTRHFNTQRCFDCQYSRYRESRVQYDKRTGIKGHNAARARRDKAKREARGLAKRDSGT